MHPVAQHLLYRKDKNIPVNDGRKIILVLHGGLMASILGGAALRVLEELKLTKAFDEIYTASAGFVNASYFLAGQVQNNTRIYDEYLASKEFVNTKKFWRPVNLKMFRKAITEMYPLQVEKVLQSRTKLYALLFNTGSRKIEYIEAHTIQPQDYFKLIDATVTMKYFGDGPVILNGQRYIDGQFIGLSKSYTPHYIQDVLNTDATDILIIYSRRRQWEFLKLPDSERLHQIYPDESWDLFNFEIRPEVLRAACAKMEQKMKKLFSA